MPIAHRWAALVLTAALAAAGNGPAHALSSAIRRSPARLPRGLSLRV
ncbi:hypothetical protein ACFWAT_10415 [Streptomyces syringium]